MRWLEPKADSEPPLAPALALALLCKAVARFPGRAQPWAKLGDALVLGGDYPAALQAYARAESLDGSGFRAWNGLALSYLRLDRPQDALDACERGLAHGSSAELLFLAGRALRKLHRDQDAHQAFRQALDLGDVGLASLTELLRLLAKKEDGAELLAFCDGLDMRVQETALVRAYRAIALSRLGRTAEARQLVDLERHIARVPFAPPAAFGGIERFNRTLCAEILANPSPDLPLRDGLDINYSPRTQHSPAFQALYDFMRSAMVDYVGELAARGLDGVMPPPPAAGTFFTSSVVLRADGKNGEHIHPRGYISVVYHALVPDSITQANDERGSLALGCCQSHTGGYAPCWGTRYVKPVPGWLVLFPSHLFHDVVPSGTDSPRISVVADLFPEDPKSASGTSR